MSFSDLLLYSLVITVGFFIYRRRVHGEARSEALFYSITIYGVCMAAGSFLFFKSIYGVPRGMGMEIFVYPGAFLIGGFIAAVIITPLFMSIESSVVNGKAPSEADQQIHIVAIEKEAKTLVNGSGSDWRDFARSVGRRK